MHSQPQNNKYGFDVLQRYHDGTLSAAERHAVEKAALDDPFLADALEGYASTKTAGADVAALQKGLNQRIEKGSKRGVVLNLNGNKWLRIAAVLIVLLGAGWGSYQLLTRDKDNIAVTGNSIESTPAEKQTPSIDSSTILNKTTASKTSEASVPTPKNNEAIVARKQSKKTAPKPQQNQPAATVQAEITELTAANNNSIADKVLARAATTITPDSTKEESILFQGKVIDAKGNAVPFATIASSDKKLITTTDLNGSFTLPAADTTVTVTATALGYQALSLQLTAPAPNLFILPESASALNEVVVTGFSKKREKADRKSILESGSLEPTEGWQHFDDYLTQNLQQTKLENPKLLNGTVTLAFEVSDTGEPENIKVIKSQCTLCEAEAIRILKSGPKWKTGKKGRVKIRF